MPTDLTIENAIPRCDRRIHRIDGLPERCGNKMFYKSAANAWYCPMCGTMTRAQAVMAQQKMEGAMTFT